METVVEGVTGEFFNEPTIEAMADAIRRFMENEEKYDAEKIREQAGKFSKDKFEENFLREIEKIVEQGIKVK